MPWGIREVKEEQLTSQNCYKTSFQINSSHIQVYQIDYCIAVDKPEMEDLDEVSISLEYPDHKVQIGSMLEDNIRRYLIAFLSRHHHCFAWSHADMTGIDLLVITHKLQVDPECILIRQKRRKFAPERNQIINDEVQKLIDIGSVREVEYPKWLVNIVVVKKKNRK